MAVSIQMSPRDLHNRELIANVHPPDWTNPAPYARYHLVVLGAGTAGLVAAAAAAGLGARVALVERHLMGGDCLNAGCVPSKALIRSARMRAELSSASEFGLEGPGRLDADFAAVMERLRRLRAAISRHDSARRFAGLGVHVFLGEGRFTGPDRIEVAGGSLRFRKALVATGGRPAVPPVPGLAESGFLTSETVFSLTERPTRLLVMGGGPVGCELAQAFARLGSRVCLVETGPQFLPREDPDAAEILGTGLRRDGVEICLNTRVDRVENRNGTRAVQMSGESGTRRMEVEAILVAVGRVPNVEGANLEAAGIRYDARTGVEVNDRLRTSNPNVYAAGDVCLRHRFTHTADAAARIVIQNALFPGARKVSALTVPWCTYTSPEIAHVGLHERDAEDRGIRIASFQIPFSQVDRAVLDGEEEGFVKVHVKKGSDKIVGATIVAERAGDMIHEITLAMVAGVGLSRLAEVIHPYPTRAEAIRKVADAYNRTRLTPLVRRLLGFWFSLTR